MKYLIILSLLVFSCASPKPKKVLNKRQCENNNANSIEQKHATLSAKRQGNSLINCFKNYLRFEKNKKQSLNICHTVNISKSGNVTYMNASGMNQRIPADFKMCLEQSLRVMKFKSLQLSKNLYLKFPINYQSK